jgi:hypothetical protein
LIFVSRPKLPVPLFSYLLFELKQALDCFEHCKLLGGQLVYYRKDSAKPYCSRPFAVDLRRSLY